jgi:hypothetical protein
MVTDKDGGSQTSATANVEVDNVAPTATLSNSGPIDEASSATVSFTGAADVSPLDTAAGFHYSFALGTDGLANTYDTAGTTPPTPSRSRSAETAASGSTARSTPQPPRSR